MQSWCCRSQRSPRRGGHYPGPDGLRSSGSCSFCVPQEPADPSCRCHTAMSPRLLLTPWHRHCPGSWEQRHSRYSVLPSFLGQQIPLPRGGQSLIKILFPCPCSSFIQQTFIEHLPCVRPISVCQGHHSEQSTVLPSGHSPCRGGQTVNRPTWDICSGKCCKRAKGVLLQEGCQASEPSNF